MRLMIVSGALGGPRKDDSGSDVSLGALALGFLALTWSLEDEGVVLGALARLGP
jgi:hypothetical protein